MPLYELSIDEAHVRAAERVVALEGRGYPTLVVSWESRLFDQAWTTTIVSDYTIPLPPLMAGQASFNEVRVAAFVGGAPTKFLYFGTEMSEGAPRVAPEMENLLGPPKAYQEFRLEERTCPIPYLKLIQATPRIFGNSAQDYYSPPIKVERFDGAIGPEDIADYFPTIVANLPAVGGDVLTDPSRGFWTGGRFIGVGEIAIVRQGVVVGLCRRAATPREGKDPLPSELKRRDPKLDVLRKWVAIDFGASTTVVAIGGEKGAPEMIRLGETSPPSRPSDFENPSEIYFASVARTVKAWKRSVVLPVTRWEDVRVGHAAREQRLPPAPPAKPARDSSKPPPPVTGPDPQRVAPALTELSWLRERIERQEAVHVRGAAPDDRETLKKPAPPVVDEDGIGAHDPFDPIELYAYYVGLHVNQRSRGIVTRYLLTLPTGWPAARRESVVVAFRRGLYRSLPAGLVPFEDLDELRVVDAGPGAIPFAAHAFRVFGIHTRGEPARFCAIDAGASETGVVCGVLRAANDEEKEAGFDRVIEHLDPAAVAWLGGERLLHRLALQVWTAHGAQVREHRIPIEPCSEGVSGDARDLSELAVATVEARINSRILRDALRPVLEGNASVKIPASLLLYTVDATIVDVPLTVDREALTLAVRGWLAEGAAEIGALLRGAVEQIGKPPDPYAGLHVFLGGRMGMSAMLGDELARALPSTAKLHRYTEPDRTNPSAPTVKTACALGALSMRFDRIGAVPRSEARAPFGYRVGRARHGQLADVLDPSADYDAWYEMGSCSKPDVDVLFMRADETGEVAADDPRVGRGVCALGHDAVGRRLYLRAVGPSKVEVSVGPPGGEPDEDAPCWALDLGTGSAAPSKGD